MKGPRFSLVSGLRRGVVMAGVVGGALTAQAQFGAGWKMAMGPHDLCCGPRGGIMGDNGSGAMHLPPEENIMAPTQLLPGDSSANAAGSASGTSAPTQATAPAAAEAAPAKSAAPKTARTADGYDKVSFDLLASFEFVAPEFDPSVPDAKPPSGAHQIPAPVKALDQRKVAVTGFMLPTKMEGGFVKEFLLVKDAMLCCYGAMPKINEWVVVKMTGKGVKPLMDVPITFEGKLSVGEMYENGYLTGLYLLDGDRMADVKG